MTDAHGYQQEAEAYLLLEFIEHILHSALFRQPNIVDYNLK